LFLLFPILYLPFLLFPPFATPFFLLSLYLPFYSRLFRTLASTNLARREVSSMFPLFNIRSLKIVIPIVVYLNMYSLTFH